MKVSLWQQFSSNHSARFTVVGEFASPESARQAAQELEKILTSITRWYQAPENAVALNQLEYDFEGPGLSDPEQQVAAHYGIDWGERGIDWFWINEEWARPLTWVDRLVFITSGDTWQGAHPADKLMAHLGGRVKVDGARSGEGGANSAVIVDLTCTASDAVVASTIVREVEAYLVNKASTDKMFDTPWQSDNNARRGELSDMSGKVNQQGEHLRFERLQFFHIGYGLPGLIDYLVARGCRDIDYQLTERVAREWEEEGD